jgi:hypothetical protein
MTHKVLCLTRCFCDKGIKHCQKNIKHRSDDKDFKKVSIAGCQGLAHVCNPSYSGGNDQEDRGSKPAQVNGLKDPILKKILHKKGLVEWFKV